MMGSLLTEDAEMTNAQINDFLKDAITIFRKYRDRRPITDEKTEHEVFAAYEMLTEKYGVYVGENNEIGNPWIIDFMFNGLLRELEASE